MISHLSTAIWNKSFHEKNQKVHFGRNPLFPTFRRKLLLQMAVERWEIILKTCFRYEKHSSESEQYASKKIRVIRRVEMKILQEMDENVVFPTAVSCNQYKKNLQTNCRKSGRVSIFSLNSWFSMRIRIGSWNILTTRTTHPMLTKNCYMNPFPTTTFLGNFQFFNFLG